MLLGVSTSKYFFRCGAKILLLISTVLGGQLPKCCRLGEVTININLIIIDHHYHRHNHLFHLQLNKKQNHHSTPVECHVSQFL